MLHEFDLYDLFVLCFVQLVVSTVFVLSPLRYVGTRFQWTGSRITEVILGGLGAVAVAALSVFITAQLWGLPANKLETAAYILTIFSVIVMILRPDCNVVGQVFYASYAAAGFTFLAFAALVAADATHSIAEALTSTLLILLDLGAFLVWNSNINYVSDVLCRTRHGRPLPKGDPTYQPMVSIHIPAHSEPPEILINTIKAVEAMDYPDFEIVVIDNNTADPALWKPVEEYCKDRPRVKFVHVGSWPGYKAGACNLALRQYTDPRAEIIALVDADDIVKPYYLRGTVSYFSDARLGFVQTCEGNRDYEGSADHTVCVDSYKGFYLAVMSSRNERDTVPFVGTMGLFRRSALLEVGGWNEWCISEDTEASLRVLKNGWSGVYIPRCFGRGIVPPTFAGLNTQRHRWCFGAMQILRLHWRSLMPWDRSEDNHLTGAQRRDYLMASLGWFRDLLMLGFASSPAHHQRPTALGRQVRPDAIGWRQIVAPDVAHHHRNRLYDVDPPPLDDDLPSPSRAGPAHQPVRRLDNRAGMSRGMSRREGVFLRTSKVGPGEHQVRKAIRLVRSEAVLAVALYVCAALLAGTANPPLLLIFIVCLQGTVYLCAPIAALWNLRAQRVPALEYRQRYHEKLVRMARDRRWSVRIAAPLAALLLAAATGVGFALLAAPSDTAATPQHVGVGTSNQPSASAASAPTSSGG